MKKSLFFILLMLGLSMSSCSDDSGLFSFGKNTNTRPQMVAGGGVVNIQFSTDQKWRIYSHVDWLTSSVSDGLPGDVEFFINVAINETNEERKGIVSIILANGDTYKIVVTQAPENQILHLECQDNEILYTTKYNYILGREYENRSGFGDSSSIVCVEHKYLDSYGYLKFNDDITKIPSWAFHELSSLETIYLPDGIEYIDCYAFENCTNLKAIISNQSSRDYRSVVINGELQAVALAGLTSYTIPDNVKVVCYCFSTYTQNVDLQEITFGSNVEEIHYIESIGTSTLRCVYMKPITPPNIGYFDYDSDRPFKAAAADFVVYVPYESIDNYKKAEGWRKIKSHIVGYNF